MSQLAEGLLYFVVFLMSTTLHEAAHAWAAMRGGDLTAYNGGQVTLDPRPHMRREPFGMVVLPLLTAVTLGFPMGFASAPYSVDWARTHPRRAAWMALAGPAANFLLFAIALVALRAGVLFEVFDPPQYVRFGDLAASSAGEGWAAVGRMLSILFSLNLLLCAFNLLPFPPLDGSAVITLFMGKGLTAKYQHFIWTTPALAFIGMFAAWRMFNPLFMPLFFGAVNLIYPGMYS